MWEEQHRQSSGEQEESPWMWFCGYGELHPSKMTERAEWRGRLFEWLFSILRKLELSLIEVLPVSWTHG